MAVKDDTQLIGNCDFKVLKGENEIKHQAHLRSVICMDVINQEAHFGKHAENCQWVGKLNAKSCGCALVSVTPRIPSKGKK